MMKKNIFWNLLAIMMVGLLSVSFVSCGDDDDDQEPQKEFKPWISGLVRGLLLEYDVPVYIGREHTGHWETYTDKSMVVLDFRQDGTVSEYDLTGTETVNYLKEHDDRYDGTWTLFEGHPEWSYFQGKVTDGKGNVEYERVNPKKYTYSLNTEKLSVTAKDENGKEWSWGTLYINFNPSKTVWNELRNSEGKLMFYIWDANDPLDNSKFN